jgi:hypothetical protein
MKCPNNLSLQITGSRVVLVVMRGILTKRSFSFETLNHVKSNDPNYRRYRKLNIGLPDSAEKSWRWMQSTA